MSKHTPGPWYADENGAIWRRHPSDLYENGGGVAGDKQIATAWRGWVDEGEIGYPFKNNACLIAAAPELLDALKDLEAAYERLKYPGYPVSDCQKQARAAIAKATGENQ